MRKLRNLFLSFVLIGSIVMIYDLCADQNALHDQLIRLHVVANSDSQEDQSIKLHVKDAIVSYLEPMMKQFASKEEARKFLTEHLENIRQVADDVLQSYGKEPYATVTLEQEVFDRRDYDTFSLPAGLYESLRVRLGDAEGKNWWCVVFPTLCNPTTESEFSDTAVSAGFDRKLVNTLTEDKGYEVRFFLLDMVGQVRNLFH